MSKQVVLTSDELNTFRDAWQDTRGDGKITPDSLARLDTLVATLKRRAKNANTSPTPEPTPPTKPQPAPPSTTPTPEPEPVPPASSIVPAWSAKHATLPTITRTVAVTNWSQFVNAMQSGTRIDLGGNTITHPGGSYNLEAKSDIEITNGTINGAACGNGPAFLATRCHRIRFTDSFAFVGKPLGTPNADGKYPDSLDGSRNHSDVDTSPLFMLCEWRGAQSPCTDITLEGAYLGARGVAIMRGCERLTVRDVKTDVMREYLVFAESNTGAWARGNSDLLIDNCDAKGSRWQGGVRLYAIDRVAIIDSTIRAGHRSDDNSGKIGYVAKPGEPTKVGVSALSGVSNVFIACNAFTDPCVVENVAGKCELHANQWLTVTNGSDCIGYRGTAPICENNIGPSGEIVTPKVKP